MLRTSRAQLPLTSQSDASPFGPARKIHYSVARIYTLCFIATFSKRQELSHPFSLLLLKCSRYRNRYKPFDHITTVETREQFSCVCFYVLENIYIGSSGFSRFALTFSKALQFCQRPERFVASCFI